MTHSTRPKRGRKRSDGTLPLPKKPYDKFPLSPHPSGKWQKRIGGNLYYFGNWKRRKNGKEVPVPGDGWKEAEAEYNKRLPEILNPDAAPADGEGMTVAELCNKFLRSKLLLLQSGEITPRTFAEYRGTTDRVVECFGRHNLVDRLRDEDFEQLRANLATKFGVVRLGNEIVRVKGVFKHGKKRDLVPETFRKPAARQLRKHRNEGGKRLFTAEEIRTVLDGRTVPGKKPKVLAGASVQLRAMILLGMNCGFGNADVSDLPQTAVDLKAGWIDFPRPKTGIGRRCPLWPETVAALKAAKAQRPKHNSKADRDCVFITQQGRRWVRVHVKDKAAADGGGSGEPGTTVQIDAVGSEFRKLLKRFEINGRRGLGFYSLRHTFRTVADATLDQPAIRLIMGHTDGSIDNIYRESIDDSRLLAVTNHVRAWLFGGAT